MQVLLPLHVSNAGITAVAVSVMQVLLPLAMLYQVHREQ
jgi:hypothetical protein